MEKRLYNTVTIAERLRGAYFGEVRNAPKIPRVLIYGIGKQGGGTGALRFFTALGWSVLAFDKCPRNAYLDTIKNFRHKHILWKFGTLQKNALRRVDLLVKNPAIPLNNPYLKEAKKRGIPITNDADIFLRLVPRNRIIGITGTKGKTTTAMLLAHFLRARYRTALLGIPGTSFLNIFVERLTSNKKALPQYIVVELSSFDLDLTTKSPAYALITSCYPEHLNRYSNFIAYCTAKSHIFHFQTADDYLFLPQNGTKSNFFKKHAPGKIRYFGEKNLFAFRNIPTRVYPGSAAAASAIASQLGIPKHIQKQRLRSFHAPDGRREIVCKKRGIIFINDTTASNPRSAAASLEMEHKERKRSGGSIILIAGGQDKRFPKSEIRHFTRALTRHAKAVVLLPGSFTKHLLALLPKSELADKHVSTAKSIEEAVKKAFFFAEKHDAVLLSPGAASFNLFQNEFDRGERFINAIQFL